MQYINLGHTDLRVSRLCIGLAFRSEPDLETSIATIHTAADMGCNYLDVANIYRDGYSETIVGKAIEGQRDRFVLSTKVGSDLGGSAQAGLDRENILSCCEDSLRRLNTDYLDCYLCHLPDVKTPIEETLGAFDTLVKQGKVRYIGCSNFESWRLGEGLYVADHKNLPHFACNQVGYSLLDRRIENELVPLCADRGVGVTVYAVTAIGLLTGRYKYGDPPPAGSSWHRGPYNFHKAMTPRVGEVIDAVIEVANRHGKTPTQVATAWCLRLDVISSVIVGTDTPERAKENFAEGDWVMPKEDADYLDAISEGQWMQIHKDCPQGYLESESK